MLIYLQIIGGEDEKPKFQQIYEAYSQLMYYEEILRKAAERSCALHTEQLESACGEMLEMEARILSMSRKHSKLYFGAAGAERQEVTVNGYTGDFLPASAANAATLI